MVARLLQGAGVFMGESLDDVVFEDHEFARLFTGPVPDDQAMNALLRKRNRARKVWGFKRPQLHQQDPKIIDLFRNPTVIITVRDPVAIAERYAIAEQIDPARSLSVAMDDLQQMLNFAQALTCPVLLVSYEKALLQPERFMNGLFDFCKLNVSAVNCKQLITLIEPNRDAYINSARRIYDGYVDCITGTLLVGWAYQRGLGLPLALTVFSDEVPIRRCVADLYRKDLAESGMDDGKHGFVVDLGELGLTRDSRITVRVEGRNFTLNNSGATVGELGGDVELIETMVASPFIMTFVGA